MKQTIKVQIEVFVGGDKTLMNTYHTWNPETDDLSADETAKALLWHLYHKMESSLDPCYFDHEKDNNGTEN